ncbi:hypothetical protein CF319_g6291 [Tilletia indica]|nr:hypothetical protein CF319_g6291 [Tilletia indica]
MAFTLPALALRRSTTAALVSGSCSRAVAATAPPSALSLALASSRQSSYYQRTFATSALRAEEQNNKQRSTPTSSGSSPSDSAKRDSAKAKPRKELFSVFTPSSRSQQAALRNNKDASSSSASSSSSSAAATADGETTTDAEAEVDSDAAEGSSSTAAPQVPSGPKMNSRYLHGQLIAPTAFTPLSQVNSPTEQSPYRNRARPLLGPSANLAKRLDPFFKLGLNPSKPTLKDDSYKNPSLLTPFVSDLGRILPRNRTGLTRKGQRQVGKAIRRARAMGLVPIFNRGTGRSSGYAWR